MGSGSGSGYGQGSSERRASIRSAASGGGGGRGGSCLWCHGAGCVQCVGGRGQAALCLRYVRHAGGGCAQPARTARRGLRDGACQLGRLLALQLVAADGVADLVDGDRLAVGLGAHARQLGRQPRRVRRVHAPRLTLLQEAAPLRQARAHPALQTVLVALNLLEPLAPLGDRLLHARGAVPWHGRAAAVAVGRHHLLRALRSPGGRSAARSH